MKPLLLHSARAAWLLRPCLTLPARTNTRTHTHSLCHKHNPKMQVHMSTCKYNIITITNCGFPLESQTNNFCRVHCIPLFFLATSKFLKLTRQFRRRSLTTNSSSCSSVPLGRGPRMSCDCSLLKPGQGSAHAEVTALSEHTWTEIKQSERASLALR